MRRRHRGFTLIETVAAITILAVAVPPMVWAIQEAHHHRADPVLFSTARFLATAKLEDVVADRHSPNRDYAWLIAGNYPAENPGDITGYPQYGRTVAFSEHGAWNNGTSSWSAGTDYMEVTVTVTWTDSQGIARSLAISTILTNYDAT
jgi:prepilin-type N-terminal cleavage/methylation domain-containing protein